MTKVLIVEDEAIVAEDLKGTLNELGYDVPAISQTAEEAVKAAGEIRPDIILMDIVLKGNLDGIKTAEQIMTSFDIPVIYLTAHADGKTFERAKATSPFGYIVKPFETPDLQRVLEMALNKHALESRVRESEEKFRSLFNQASDSIFLMSSTDRGLIIEDANEAACTMHGYTREELIGKPISVLDEPETGRHIPERTKTLLAGRPLHFEGRHVRKDGSVFPAEISAQLIHIGGKPYILAIDRDITVRKKAEEKLKQISAYNRSLIEASLDPFVTIAADGKITDVNIATEKVTGYSRKELIGTDFSDYFTEPENARAGYQHVFREGMVHDYALEIRHREGHITPVIYNASVYTNEEGEVIGVFAAARDITERKRAEEDLQNAIKALADEKAKLDAIIAAIGDGISIQDTNFKVLYQNQLHINMLGYKVGEYCYKAYQNRDAVCERCHLAMCFQDGKVHRLKQSRTTDGETFYYEIIASPVRDSFGKIIAGIEAVRDITDSKRLEDALHRSHQALINVLDGIEAIVYVADMKTYELLYLNKYAKSIFGDAVGKICWQALQSGQAGLCGFCTNDKLLDGCGKPVGVYHWEFQNTANGRWYDIRDRAIEWIDGNIVRLEIATDISSLKEAEEALRSMSFVDDLTGLHNRRGFLTLAYQQLKTARRDKKIMMLIFADIDNMKSINDTLGHITGDQALRDASAVLKKTFRESDIIARIGGDEFVVLAMETPDANPASLTKRLQAHLDEYNAPEGKTFNLSLSIGITYYDPENPSTVDELLYKADTLMYINKKEKKKV
ncbi:MAG: PAS domain S-box protein [Nitrospirae bacterium]|nr:PAS domain S-box protein [Nitrospirota bacterium]